MNTTMKVYVIWDKVAETSGFLFEQTNDQSAIRSVKSQIKENKEDFVLLRLGEINHINNKLDAYSAVKVYDLGNEEE